MFVGDKKMQQLNTAFRGISKTTDVLSFPQLGVEEQKRRRKIAKKYGRAEEQKSLKKFTSGLSDLRTSALILGDIVVSVPAAETQAEMRGVDFYDEIHRLLIHSVLHLLGCEHEKSSSRARGMRKKEGELLNALKKMG